MSSLNQVFRIGLVTTTIGVQALLAAGVATAQPGTVFRDDVQVIVPPVRHRPWIGIPQSVRVQAVNASVAIDHQVATTTLEYSLYNPAPNGQEAQMMIPVPDGVTVRSLQYDGTGPEPTAKLLPRDEARRIYDSIVNRQRDPALLEFVGYNMIKTSVFPVPAGATQKVRITYEHLLSADGERVDYVLPRSDSLEATGSGSGSGSGGVAWSITTTIKSPRPIATIYSASHQIAIDRPKPTEAKVTMAPSAANQPGSFRLSYVLQKGDGLSASFIAYPDTESADGGGYLLLLAGTPELAPDQKTQKREITVVMDRSGSMRGPKMEQAKAAALQVVEGLAPGEAFNIIDYSDSINSFKPQPVVKTSETMAEAREYIKAIQAGGGTNIKDSMVEALRPEPTAGMLPMILFLTDGLPTVGERNEVAIRESIKAQNAGKRRIFSFGVGFDVNAPLLTALARGGRGTSTFVLPDEDVEVKVSQVYKRLSGPVMAAPKLTALAKDGSVSTQLLRDIQPGELGDLFDGDQVVLLARYTGKEPFRVKIDGAFLGEPRSFEFNFDPSAASVRNGFVPRLWATRRIGSLLEEVRALGAAGTSATTDPRFKELTDEIVRLSTTYGVLTEYTAFLAVEPGMVAADGSGRRIPNYTNAPAFSLESFWQSTDESLKSKAVADRAGSGGVAQEANISSLAGMSNIPSRQAWVDKDMKQVEALGVESMNQTTMICRGNRWVESSLVMKETEEPEVTVEFGTPEFNALLDQLVSEGRQGVLSRGGDIYLLVKNKRTLVKCPC